MGQVRAATLALLLAAAAVAALAVPAGAATSKYFGAAGEKWKPTGPFIDFSYAGYRQSNAVIPTPPVTKSLREFQTAGRSDTEALLKMVAWANQQPASAGWVVLELPAGRLTLDKPLKLTRAQTVLRGAGAKRTTLYLPNSFTDLYGRSDAKEGGYIFWGAFITAEGKLRSSRLARVTSTPGRGAYALQVDSTAKLKVGDLVTLEYGGGNGELARAIMNNNADPGSKYKTSRAYFSSPIAAIRGNMVFFQRALPLAVKKAYDAELVDRSSSVHSIGIEGFTMEFKWSKYVAHHYEAGYSGIELIDIQDSWVRDMRMVNVDNGVLISGCDRLTVAGLELTQTKPREGKEKGWHGHWGVRIAYATDILVQDFDIQPHFYHAVGADGHAMFSAFHRGRMADGNLELHRAQAAQILFTDIDLGRSSGGFKSGGPATSGPNSGAWTTFFNIRSSGRRGGHPLPDNNAGDPGDCSYGPNLNFIGVRFEDARRLCKSWVYEPAAVTPTNLFEAQLKLRR